MPLDNSNIKNKHLDPDPFKYTLSKKQKETRKCSLCGSVEDLNTLIRVHIMKDRAGR